jgi:EmrB/QacA subfamily drug resistance transporter
VLLRLLAVMVLGGLMSFLDASIVNVGIDTLAAHFQVSLATITWVATGYLLAVSVAIPIAGWAVSRFGTKRMWLIGLSLFLVGSALSALAWDAGSLIAFRVVQGLGGGMIEPIMLAVVAGAAGPNRMGRAMALISVPITMGPVLGPIVGGLILENLTWQWMFLVNLPIAALAIVLSIRVLPPDPPGSTARDPFDALGVALLCPGFAALVYALSQAGDAGFGATRVIVGLVVGVTLFAGYVAHAQRTAAPLVDLRLFANRGFAASVTTMFLLGGMLFSLLFLLPLYYQQVRGQNVLGAGLLLMPLGLGMMIGMPVAGNLADRIGPRPLVPTGSVLIAVGALFFTQAAAGTSGVWLTGVQILIGFGMGLVGAPTMGSVYRTVPAEAVGSATGTVFILNQIGASLGIAVATLILQGGITGGAPLAEAFAAAFWWAFAAALVVLIASLALPGRPATRAPAENGSAAPAGDHP